MISVVLPSKFTPFSSFSVSFRAFVPVHSPAAPAAVAELGNVDYNCLYKWSVFVQIQRETNLMKKYMFFLALLLVLVSAAGSVFAEEKLIWSNFNNDPVKNPPVSYPVFPVPEDHAPVLITRIRTYHWNNGSGAEPGEICAYEGNTTAALGCWQAVGRSAYGVRNVYWEALTDLVMYPGRSYGIKVSDFDSWSCSEGSDNYGMIELYGVDPAPEEYTSSLPPVTSRSASASYIIPDTLSAGQTFLFGRYEQDNDPGNGAEPIEWQVLTVSKDQALAVSRYALDLMPYNDVITEVTWDDSSLRRWLNGEFYETGFTAGEKSRILYVKNQNPDNPEFGTDGGNQTNDRIFILSAEQAQRYFKSDAARVCQRTDYAAANHHAANSTNPIQIFNQPIPDPDAVWWLRTPGDDQLKTVITGKDGKIDLRGYSPVTAAKDVRPAFWLKIKPKPTPTPTPRPVTCYTVTYKGGNCLNRVPVDKKCYRPGDTVKVLFEPVEYVPGLIFSGWDRTGDGTADHGYSYDKFTMPAKNVVLTATCYWPQYDNQDQYYDVTIEDRQQQYYDPGNNGSALYPDNWPPDGTNPNWPPDGTNPNWNLWDSPAPDYGGVG